MRDDQIKPQPILIRAFSMPAVEDETPPPETGKRGKKKTRRKIEPIGPESVSLIFDVETTVDPAMRARVGFYQLRIDDRLDEEALIYDPREAFPGDTDAVIAFAASRGMAPPITFDAFRLRLLSLYDAGGQIIGFNLPFDLSRIAIGCAPAKSTKWNKAFRGGHSLALSDSDYRPRIQIKHLSPRAALMQFSSPNRGVSRSARGRNDDIPVRRGTFIDVRTIAGALLAGNFSLERLTRTLKTPTQKTGTSAHGKALIPDYLDYARADVQATWECYIELRDRYAKFGLDTPLGSIRSGAGIGKAMLSQMGVTVRPNKDPNKIARDFHTYYGGRTEIRIRRKVVPVVLTDFMSMYPTVCTLMRLWNYVIAEFVTERDATEEIRDMVAGAVASDWQRKDRWRELTTLVRVRCAKDMFPVRGYYQGELHASIGLNKLTYKDPLWFTLADVLAAKFLSGKTPEILEAVTFEPGPPQSGLKPIKLLGNITIDPYRDDPFRELVVMREKEARREGLTDAEREASDYLRQTLKIIVNSMSYGIFVQINTHDETRKVSRLIHVHGEEPFAARISKSEEPGPYFYPLLGTLITGAARLMLALAQHRAGTEGLDWAFCDTDSMALAQPDGMARPDFLSRANAVVEWFRPLNPYGFDDPILKVEAINYAIGTKDHLPLYCYAVASKRYALFNITGNNKPILRKASAHGLGQYSAPYSDDDGARAFPPPIDGLKAGKDRLARWQYDVWYATVFHELSGTQGNVRFDYHPALKRPLISKYHASSPEMLRWLKPYNDRFENYADQVKPFGALYALHPKKRPIDFTGPEALTGKAPANIHPIAPFHPDREIAIAQAFDRITGEPIAADQLQTYANALKRYPYKQESKFLNGEAYQRGVTEPRHVIASEIHYIGKEADRWEEDFLIGLGYEPMTKFGSHPGAAAQVYTEIRMAARIHGKKPVADATGLARSLVDTICAGGFVRTKVPHDRIQAALQGLAFDRSRRDRERRAEIEMWEQTIEAEGGLRIAAKKLGVDPSNMAKAIARFHSPTPHD